MKAMAAEKPARKKRRPKRSAKQVAKDIDIQVRRQKALQLKRDGWGYEAIAKKLKVSVGTAHSDVSALLDELAENSQDLARKERALQLDRLDIAIKAIMAKVRKGDYDAIHRMERLEKRRADLLGLDAPTRVQAELSGTVSLDDIDELREAALANGCTPPASTKPPASPSQAPPAKTGESARNS